MYNSDNPFQEISAHLNLGKDGDPYLGNIILTEGGELTIEFEEGIVEAADGLSENWNTITGTDERGFDVEISDATTIQHRNFSLTRIRPRKIVISDNKDQVPGANKELVFDYDVLCFLPDIPPRNQLSEDSRETIEEISEDHDQPVPDISNEFEYGYIDTDEASISGITLTDTTDRRDYIKDTGRPLRTARIRVRHEGNGDISHRFDRSEEFLLKVLELTQLVQEVKPVHIRGTLVSVDGTSVNDTELYYEYLRSGGTVDVAAKFSQFPKKVLWGDFPEYIEQAYGNYTEHVRDDLRLRHVLGYYVDARDPNRPIEGKLLSVCAAIEMFALWHAREDGVSEKTGPKIENLVNKLGVDTSDLANEVVADVSQLSIPEYFWRRERNYVVHGDPDASTDEVITSFRATLVLLKRLVRNQLLGEQNADFQRFYDMHPPSSIEFTD